MDFGISLFGKWGTKCLIRITWISKWLILDYSEIFSDLNIKKIPKLYNSSKYIIIITFFHLALELLPGALLTFLRIFVKSKMNMIY